MSKTIRIVSGIILGILSITFIIISMVTDKITPYLALGLACSGIYNIVNCILINHEKKSKKTIAPED